MNRPLVTVVMNCFNGEAFLSGAIESVLTQTFTDWEIVFWDNQSSDRSADIVKSYQDPRIRYFHAPTHTLLYEARNYAIEKAEGQLLAFLDVDDRWLPEKLERQVALFNNPEVAIACSNFWVQHDLKGKRWLMYKSRLPEGMILDQLLKNYRIGLLTLMLRRAALPLNPFPFDPRYHIIGDFDLVIRLAAWHKVASINLPLAVYRIHGNNETSLRRRKHIAELELWHREMGNDPVISASESFIWVATFTAYVKAMDALLSGDRIAASKSLANMRWGLLKCRILLALLLPIALVKRLKN
jgi:glycosyltransferase involved in cell wall biosynthesis